MSDELLSKFHRACGDGDINQVKELLTSHNDIRDAINKCVYNNGFGGTLAAIHLAVEGMHKEVCQFLLSNGASTSVTDSEGYSPIHIACNVGNVDVLNLLLDNGADPESLVERIGSTTLHEAVCSGSLEIVEALLDRISNKDLVNHQDTKGWSPLHYACQYGHNKIVKVLLAHKAKVDLQVQIGRTSLHLAAFEGHSECVKLLLDHHCDVDVQDEEGWTAIILACQEGHPEIVQMLIEHCPDLSLVSNLTGRNAIHAASFHGHLQCISHVLEADCDNLIHASDKDGWTPLHLAAQEGHHY